MSRKDRLLVLLSLVAGVLLSPLFIHEGWADPALGPTLKVFDSITTIASTHALKFTSGCTVTANGSEADVACVGSGGTITSVTGSGSVVCVTVGTAVTCTGPTVQVNGASTAQTTINQFVDDVYGDGSTAAGCTLDGVTTPVCGCTLSGSTYVCGLPGGIQAGSSGVTVNSGVNVRVTKVRSQGTVTVAGRLGMWGNSASGISGGGSINDAFNGPYCYQLNCGYSGGNGGNNGGAGNAGTNTFNYGMGGAGGTGTTACGFAAGAGGTVVQSTTVHDYPFVSPYFDQGFFQSQTLANITIVGGAGGGGGPGGAGINCSGGGGGGGGGVFEIDAPTITITGAGSIDVNGGTGGNANLGAGTCSEGGSGGGGGVIRFRAQTYNGFPFTTTGARETVNANCATFFAKGGSPGNGAGTGPSGGTGNNGHCSVVYH